MIALDDMILTDQRESLQQYDDLRPARSRSGQEKRAQRSRYSRYSKPARNNGTHRRRNKRNWL